MNAAVRARSSSVTPSEKSNRSRITVAEDDPKIAVDLELLPDHSHRGRKGKPGLIDRILGFVGLCRQEKGSNMRRQNSGWENPWIIDVLVLTPQKNTDEGQARKIGRCTIDTGNTQGNIVSRRFVEKVLEYPKSSICELTPRERAGGLGVTGHKLMPEGAVYLTWYHKNSTMVFHDMRFLISGNSKIDLIIGARSCLEHGIQEAPNLMAEANGIYDRVKLIRNKRDEEMNKLLKIQETCDRTKNDLEVKLAEADKKNVDEIRKLKKKLLKATKNTKIADKRVELCVAVRSGNPEVAATIQDELSELLGQEPTKQLSPISTTSTAVSSKKEGVQEPGKRTSKQHNVS